MNTIDGLMARMTTGKFDMPVVEQGKLIGIVSIGDVVKNCVEEIENTKPKRYVITSASRVLLDRQSFQNNELAHTRPPPRGGRCFNASIFSFCLDRRNRRLIGSTNDEIGDADCADGHEPEAARHPKSSWRSASASPSPASATSPTS